MYSQYCNQAFIVLRICFFWDVTLRRSARGCRHVQGPQCLHLKRSSTWPLKVKALQSMNTSAASRTVCSVTSYWSWIFSSIILRTSILGFRYVFLLWAA